MYNVRLVASVRTITVTSLSFSNLEMAVNAIYRLYRSRLYAIPIPVDRYSTQVDATESTSEILLSAAEVIPSNAGSVFLNSVV